MPTFNVAAGVAWPRPSDWNAGSNPNVRIFGDGGNGSRNGVAVGGGGGSGGCHAYNGSVPWDQTWPIPTGSAMTTRNADLTPNINGAKQFRGDGRTLATSTICSARNGMILGSGAGQGGTGAPAIPANDAGNFPTTNRWGGGAGGSGTASYTGGGGGGAGQNGPGVNANGVYGGAGGAGGGGRGGNGVFQPAVRAENGYAYGGAGAGQQTDMTIQATSSGAGVITVNWISVVVEQPPPAPGLPPTPMGVLAFVSLGPDSANVTNNIQTATSYTLGAVLSTSENSGLFSVISQQNLGSISFTVGYPTSLSFGNAVMGYFNSTNIQRGVSTATSTEFIITGTWTPGSFCNSSSICPMRGGPFPAMIHMGMVQSGGIGAAIGVSFTFGAYPLSTISGTMLS